MRQAFGKVCHFETKGICIQQSVWNNYVDIYKFGEKNSSGSTHQGWSRPGENGRNHQTTWLCLHRRPTDRDGIIQHAAEHQELHVDAAFSLHKEVQKALRLSRLRVYFYLCTYQHKDMSFLFTKWEDMKDGDVKKTLCTLHTLLSKCLVRMARAGEARVQWLWLSCRFF